MNAHILMTPHIGLTSQAEVYLGMYLRAKKGISSAQATY